MGQVLGLGVSHYPPFSGHDENMAGILRGRMQDPDIPSAAKDVAGWPDAMRREWGNDQGTAAAARHRADMLVGLRQVRKALEAFNPDLVVIWGDDQYENFKESVIPAFCVHAYDDIDVYPWRQAAASSMFESGSKDAWGSGKPNYWNESPDTIRTIRGHRAAAKHIASGLLERDFDVSYAYRQLHHPGLAHAFLNAILYLDNDRQGFPWPVVPFAVNCYGRSVISYRGGISKWADRGREADPPSPSPRRCFDLGAAVGQICRESPWRVALLASSSWSHAFLVDKTWRLQPDVAADRRLYQAMIAGDAATWRNYPLAQIEESGQQEVLNWFALYGAMHGLGIACSWSDFVETWVFNSNKVSAIFGPA